MYNQTWEWCPSIACVFDVIMIIGYFQNMSQGLSIATFVFVMVVIATIISLIPGKNNRGLNAEIPSAALISMQHKIANILDPNPITTPNPKGILPVAHSIWSHHETFTLWNSLCQGAVPMAVLWIGSLPPNSFNSANFQTRCLTTECQWCT